MDKVKYILDQIESFQEELEVPFSYKQIISILVLSIDMDIKHGFINTESDYMDLQNILQLISEA